LTDGWYTVKSLLQINNTLIISGDVHLILQNGSRLTVNGNGINAGINVTGTSRLTIYAQSTNDTTMGKLTANGSGGGAGIGGNRGYSNGSIVIVGGDVTANGSGNAAGIGGGGGFTSGNGGNGGSITVIGGDVKANGHGNGAGIGGGGSVSGDGGVANSVNARLEFLNAPASVDRSWDFWSNGERTNITSLTYYFTVSNVPENSSTSLTFEIQDRSSRMEHHNDTRIVTENGLISFNFTGAFSERLRNPGFVHTAGNLGSPITLKLESIVVNEVYTLIPNVAVHNAVLSAGIEGRNGLPNVWGGFSTGVIMAADGLSIRGTANVTATGGTGGGAGIGGGGSNSGNGGTGGGVGASGITISGNAQVEATGGPQAAGIGGGGSASGNGGNGGTISVRNGTVNADGNGNGAGIGGGARADGGTITINGGDITTSGGRQGGAGIGGGGSSVGVNNRNGGNGGIITINGGIIETEGRQGGAGIGGGGSLNSNNGNGGNGGIITITGGNIKATGVSDANHLPAGGAGIGGGGSYNRTNGGIGGFGGAGGTITITGQYTIIEAGSHWSGAGIGGGGSSAGSNLDTFTGNVVRGGRGGAGGTIIIGDETDKANVSSPKVTALGGNAGAGIGGGGVTVFNGSGGGDGGTITIHSGDITARGMWAGAGIGGGGAGDWQFSGGNGGNGGNITIKGGEILAESVDDAGRAGEAAGIGGGGSGNHAEARFGNPAATGGNGGDGGNIEITGGIIRANGGSWSAGIGGGGAHERNRGARRSGHGGTIDITGGTIIANGGVDGAGIGGGGGIGVDGGAFGGDGGTITINNPARITATAGADTANAIGRGRNGASESVVIDGQYGYEKRVNGVGTQFDVRYAQLFTGLVSVIFHNHRYVYLIPDVHAITYNENVGTTPARIVEFANTNQDYEIKDHAFSREHYEAFENWKQQGDLSDKLLKEGDELLNVTTNIVLLAHWIPVQFDITYVLDGGGFATDANEPTAYNIESPLIPLVNPAKLGYTFASWAPRNYIPNGSHGDKTFTASWTANEYTVKFHRNYDTDVYSTDTFFYDGTKPLKTTPPTRDGYTFVEWTTAADGTGLKFPYNHAVNTLTTTQGDTVELFAQWEANKYTVTFDLNGGTGVALPPLEVTFDDYPPDLPAENLPARGGHDFMGFYYDVDNDYYAPITGKASRIWEIPNDATLFAKWVPYSFNINLYRNGGDGGATTATKEVGQVPAQITNLPTKPGHTFTGYADVSGVLVFDRDGVIIPNATGYTDSSSVWLDEDAKGIILWAQWKPNSYTIRFNGNESSAGSMSNQDFVRGTYQYLTLNSFEKTGYHFSGWNTSADGTGSYSFANGQSLNLVTEPDAVIELYAQWIPITYTVRFESYGGSGTMPFQPHTYDSAQALTANAFTREHYTFTGWRFGNTPTYFTDGQSVINLSAEQGAEVTLYARWTPVEYSITYFNVEPDENHADNPSSYNIETADIELQNPTRDGYRFVGWNEGSAIAKGSYGDKTFTADWIRIYTVNFYENGYDNSVILSTVQAEVGSVISPFPALPVRYGYDFTEWNTQPDGSGELVSESTAVTSNTAVYAVWERSRFDVLVESDGTGASGSGNYAYGDTVSISAGARSGWRFTGWTSSDGVVFASTSNANTTFVMPGNNVTVTANFTQNQVVIIPNPPETTTAPPVTTTPPATTAVITTTAPATTPTTTTATAVTVTTTSAATTATTAITSPPATSPTASATTRYGGGNVTAVTTTSTVGTTAVTTVVTTANAATTATATATTTATTAPTVTSGTPSATPHTTAIPPATTTRTTTSAPQTTTATTSGNDGTVVNTTNTSIVPPNTTEQLPTPPPLPPPLYFGTTVTSSSAVRSSAPPARTTIQLMLTSPLTQDEPPSDDITTTVAPTTSAPPRATAPPRTTLPQPPSDDSEVTSGIFGFLSIPPAIPPLSGGVTMEDSTVLTLFGHEMLVFAPLTMKSWSMGNLILVSISMIFLFAGIVRALSQKKRELGNRNDIMNYSDEISLESKNKIIWLAISSVTGVLSVFLFLVFQNRSYPMVLVDFWTFVHVVLLIAEITAVILAFKKHKKATSAITEIEKNALPI
jgi:uncharacterized repeat protein (TIGR02543 family)